MIILGIETSCDETAAAVLLKDGNRIQILSNVIASSSKLQEKFGGIMPEQAAREQIKAIIPVISGAINDSRLTIHDIDTIAVTQGPGLIGSLLVGAETAKTLSLVWGKPLIPVNHLLGHFWANWIDIGSSPQGRTKYSSSNPPAGGESRSTNIPKLPCLGLLVSGGHTDLVLFKNHNKYEYLGGTRDDAAGECFDKCARLLGYDYPGGPKISRIAQKGNPKAFKLPRPMVDSNDLDFSFSGLKTAFANLVKNCQPMTDNQLTDLCASIEQTIVDSLVTKVVRAAQIYKVEQIMVAGGVAANKKLRNELEKNSKFKIQNCELFFPPPYLCTDNASMIAARGFFQKPIKNPLFLQANPNLSLYNMIL